MKIEALFPKPKKVKGFDENGKRTAYALKQMGAWNEMIADIWACENQYQLQKCRWYWAAKVEEDLWPQYWIDEAFKEFDKAVEALAALQAE